MNVTLASFEPLSGSEPIIHTTPFRVFRGLQFFVALFCLTLSCAHAAELPPGFTEETLATKLNAVTAMAAAPDGRIFIADQTGKLLIWKDGKLLDQPALTLHVTDYWERGLIGIALDPDFARNSQIYLLYVTDQPVIHHVLSRFTLQGDTIDPVSEKVLFEGDDQTKLGGNQPAGHQGGPLRFGLDGKLYIGLGEQTARNASQRLDALQGKILRLNPDGSIPEDNPFYEKAEGKYRAIWAYGIRNPFGIAFQPETGRCFVADVGESSWEEIDELIKGGNYGWPQAEGMSTNPAFLNPIHTYPPVIGRCIIGGAFYPRSPKPDAAHFGFPRNQRGKYFFADWAANWIKTLDPDHPSVVETFARGFNAPVAVEVAPDGSLLVLNRGTIWRDNKNWKPNTGSLVRIRHTDAANRLSTAEPLPPTLAGTHLFSSLEPLTPQPGFVAYEINAPPFHPGLTTRQWIRIPDNGKIKPGPDGGLALPPGTIVIQHYLLEKSGAPFETQVLWFTSSNYNLCRAAAYRWPTPAKRDPTPTTEDKDADLIVNGEIVALPGDPAHRWFSPGAETQLHLDTIVTGFLLPLNFRQIHRDHQIERWNDLGWFVEPANTNGSANWPRLSPPEDSGATLESRIRSYLDVNCAACHHPGGPARGNFDARFRTPLAQQNLINGDLVAGDLGIPGARVVVPGEPEKSILLERLTRHDQFRMPPVSVNDDPSPIVPLLRDWIRSLPTTAEANPGTNP